MTKSINPVEKSILSEITTYQAGVAQAAMHRNVQKICNEILEPYGITKMHWLIIGMVLDAGFAGHRVSDLAKSLGVTIPYLTNTLHILEGRGYVIRSANTQDSRSKLVTINPSMQAKCEEIEQVLREGLRKSIYSQVSPKDFQAYLKVVFTLSGNK